MATGSRNCVLFLTTFLALLVGSHSKISESTIERDGRGIILLAEPFGFGADGHLDLTVSNLESHRSNVDFSLLGFFITSTQVLPATIFVVHSSASHPFEHKTTCTVSIH